MTSSAGLASEAARYVPTGPPSPSYRQGSVDMRVTRVLVPIVAALAAVAVAGPPASAVTPASAATSTRAAAAEGTKIGFQSSAFGTYVTALDATIRSGPTSSASITCTTVTGLTRTNTVATATLPGVGQAGGVNTKVTTSISGETRSTTSTSTVTGVNLLNGAVVAEAIAVSATASSTGGVATTSGSTTLTGLKVGGTSVAVDVAPNSRIALNVGGQRVGTVILNHQVRSTANGINNISVRGIYITLFATNPFGLPASTAIYIGGVNAAVTTPRVAFSGGSGWGLSASALNGTAVVGRQPHVGVPCFGGTARGSLATITRDPLVSTGNTQVTTFSAGTSTTATSKVVSSVAQPSILGGLITADAIVAEAQTTRTATGFIGTADRSKFVNLQVAGLPLITSDVRPNTTINLPGLGSVTFRKVTRTPTGIQVVMLEITLSSSIAGLPTGTIVQVAGADTKVLL
ncbi:MULTISPECIES: choice-of-anchor P family protein [unclassified Knoellia]|uniref:choice-of-anchor P family protein n=1 Tax=Knoellia altitudinis TaxID=3404795 RepID=UPI003616B74C